MTTIYVNHRLGVVLTDTRTTSTHYNTLFGITIKSYNTYFDDSHKAMYIHDRVFTVSGSVLESDKIIRFLTLGEPIVPANKKEKLSCNCLLVDKNWTLQFIINNGKFWKNFVITTPTWTYGTGSGWDTLSESLKDKENSTLEEVIVAFKTIHIKDEFTNDQIRLYKI